VRTRTAESFTERLTRVVFNPLTRTGNGYYALVLFLSAIVAWGLFAFATQVKQGLEVTGMRTRSWALYLVNLSSS
jgi:hypothetical protein